MAGAAGYSAGRVYLQVVPSYRNFMTALRRDARGPLGKAIADTFEKELGKAGVSSGESFGKGFNKAVEKKINTDALTRDLTKKLSSAFDDVGAHGEAFRRELQAIQKDIESNGRATDDHIRRTRQLSREMIAAAERTDDLAKSQNLLSAAKGLSPDTYKEYSSAAREAERESRALDRAERDRDKAHRDAGDGANVAQRGIFRLRDALTGATQDSNDGANAFRFFNGALLATAVLGPSLIPVLAAIAGGLVLLGPGALAAAAGLGIIGLALSGVGDAVKALSEQQNASSGDSLAYQRAVTNAARAVADAQRGLKDAQRDSSEGIRRALDNQRQAEQRLASAQRDARDAQRDLTEARKEAKADLADMDNKIAQNALDERQGVIDLFNAYNNYGAVMADGGSTNLEREEADIALKQAELNLKRIREEEKLLAAQKKKSDKQGVDGSDKVRTAEERLTDALERQKEARRDLAKAAREVDTARVDGARRVEDAQRTLTRAQEDYNYAVQGGVQAVDKLRDAMDKLSPAGQRFARFIFSLRGNLRELREEAQEGFLPGLQRGMEDVISKYGPGFQRWVRKTAELLGDMAEQSADTFTGSSWSRFFSDFGDSSQVFIKDYGTAILEILTGLANIFRISLPSAESFSGAISDIGTNFRKWTESKEGVDRIQRFFAYVDRVGPKVREFFGALVGAIVALGIALGPIGESVLSFLTDALQSLSEMDTRNLTLIAAGIAAIIIALQVSSGLVAFISLIGIIAGSPMLIAVAAIGALAAGFFLLSRSGGKTGAAFDSFLEKIQPILDIFKELGGWIRDEFMKTWERSLLPGLRKLGKIIGDDLIPSIDRFWQLIRPLAKFLVRLFGAQVRFVIEAVIDIIAGIIQVLSGVLDFITGVFTGDWGLAWGGIKKIVSGIWRVIWGTIRLFLGRIFKLIGKLPSTVGKAIKKLPGLVREGLKKMADWIGKSKIGSKLLAPFTWVGNKIQKVWDKVTKGLKGMGKGIRDFLTENPIGKKLAKWIANPLIDAFDFVWNKVLIKGVNKLAGWVGLGGKDKKVLGDIPLPKKFAKGGIFGVRPGYTPGRDNELIAVGGGEGILRPEVTRGLGAGTINRWNHAAQQGGVHAVRKVMGFAKGGIVWPTTTKQLSGNYPGHTGVDISGPGISGKPVFAAHAGRVTARNSWNYSYGKHIRIRGTDGIETIYGHLSKLIGRVGQLVKAGSQVGNVGSTGNSTGPHLHFEVRPGGTRAAALAYLNNGKIPKGGKGGKGINDKLAGLGKTAISALRDPAGWLSKRVNKGFEKVTALGGGLKKAVKAVPEKFMGGIAKKIGSFAMKYLGVAKDWFKKGVKYPVGLAKGVLGKGKDVLDKVNPFGGGGPTLYDNGGFLPPGISTVMNKTNRPEPILTGKQWDALLEARGGGDTFDLKAYGADPEVVVKKFVTDIRRQQRRARRSGTLSRKVA